MRKDIREITNVDCPPEARGQGYATAMLKAICKEADTKRMILMLTVEPFGTNPPLDKARLLEWYTTSFDFNAIQAEPLILARMFNPFPDTGLTENFGKILIESI